MNEHLQHESPLRWLVTNKLHQGTTLADRVRALRKRRRKAKVVVADLLEPQEPLVEEAP